MVPRNHPGLPEKNWLATSLVLQPKSVVAILYSRDSNCKVYNYYKVAGDTF